MHAGVKQALCCANNEKTTNQKERVRKACHRAWIGGQATPGIIMLHLSRWPSPLISSQLRILCQSFAHFSYLLLRGYHFEPCPRPADDAIIGPNGSLLPCGGVSASNQTPHLYGGYLGSAAGFEPATCARKCEVFQPLCFYFASLHHSTFELHTSWRYLSFTFSTFHVLCMVAIRSIYPLYSSICSGL